LIGCALYALNLSSTTIYSTTGDYTSQRALFQNVPFTRGHYTKSPAKFILMTFILAVVDEIQLVNILPTCKSADEFTLQQQY